MIIPGRSGVVTQDQSGISEGHPVSGFSGDQHDGLLKILNRSWNIAGHLADHAAETQRLIMFRVSRDDPVQFFGSLPDLVRQQECQCQLKTGIQMGRHQRHGFPDMFERCGEIPCLTVKYAAEEQGPEIAGLTRQTMIQIREGL